MPKPSVELNEFDFSGGSENSSANSRSNYLNRNIEGNNNNSSDIGISSATSSGPKGGNGGGTGSVAGVPTNDGENDGNVEAGNCTGSAGGSSDRNSANENNNVGGGGSIGEGSGGGGGVNIHRHNKNRDDGGGGSGRLSKKYRHQNFSKNIYIGTKNAEKWDFTRQRLAFKNDVEFVTYLLKLADNDKERIASLPHLSSTNSFGNFKLEPNLSAKNFGNTVSENGDYLPPSSTKSITRPLKRVQFHDSLNNFIKSKATTNFNLKHNAQDKSVSSSSNLINDDNDDDDEDEDEDDHDGHDDIEEDNNIPEVLDCRIAEKIKSELEQKSSANGCDSYLEDINKGAICLKKPSSKKTYRTTVFNRSDDEDDEDDDGNDDDDNDNGNYNDEIKNDHDSSKQYFRIRDRSNQKYNDIRKISLNDKLNNEDDDQNDDGDDDVKSERLKLTNIVAPNNNDDDDEDEVIGNAKFNNGVRINQSCRDCTFNHEYENCPLRNPLEYVKDAIDLNLWREQKAKLLNAVRNRNNSEKSIEQNIDGDGCNDDDDDDESSQSSNKSSQNNEQDNLHQKSTENLISFSEASLPQQFELRHISKETRTDLIGIFTKIDIPKYTRFGPLIGDDVQISDIPDDCNMKNIYEIFDGNQSKFISTENSNTSNWLRYIRPAINYDEHNINLICIDKRAYFVTCNEIKIGCELLYWSDECNSAWQKKNKEKLNCGGCNMKFEHPLYYRTHCSVFHDPSFSLTIRKYHCKICGEAVLGKENIMKHAAQKHDGKGAYQCQFCKKFFLRLNYLEMHRTYGCSANPQRARPLCDFCGRKFCQPQKLKVHIKRMHSDMAEVLRDFQCKLCSKLLGSRAALQRHSKEVHSRNSAVVSCPRCQKLFQNRSNLKIHMLTHSGVRPFKCAESECTAAFTTKQCLQFHYKKVHNYTQEQMPKIERSVAYTFDAYSGGMKVDFLEQAPRRRRKSLEDQNSILSSSMLDSKSESDFSDDNMFENVKKSGKSIKDLCRNETNLSLLSSKITSIFNKECSNTGSIGGIGKKRKKKYRTNSLNYNSTTNKSHNIMNDEDDSQDEQQLQQQQQLQHQQHQAHLELLARRKHHHHQQQQQQHNAAQLSLVESFLSTQVQRLGTNLTGQQNIATSNNLLDDPKLHDNELPHDTTTDNNFIRHHGSNSKDLLNNTCQNLVVSKGSKKWISDDDRHGNLREHCSGIGGSDGDNTTNNGSNLGGPANSSDVDVGSKIIPNRDFIARFMMNNSVTDQNQIATAHEEDENSTFLDVVDSNNHGGHLSQFQENNDNTTQLHMNPLTHPQSFINTFYNNTNSRLTAGSSASTSASMLVEAALNSVGNMMENDEENSIKCPNNQTIDNDSNMNPHIDVDTNRFGSSINNIDSLENEIKMMKNLNNFPMQIPPLPMFQNSGNNLTSCNISPDTSTQHQSNGNTNTPNNNDIDVDAGSTPRGQQIGGGTDSDRFSTHHQTPPSPQVISPGRDYAIFGSTGGANGNGNGSDGTGSNTNNISSPLPSLQSRRGDGGGGYPEHELISPASSPSIPRYDFSSEMCRKREQEREHSLNAQNQLSSDEENSIIAQNSSTSAEELRMKFTQSQMDMMYSKYDNVSNASGLKYNSNQDLDVVDFRNNAANDLSDLQGLDMTSRANIGSSNYHHNFQLPSTTNANLGLGRYHHHIYDILSEREQQQQQQQQAQQDHSSQLSMQHQQSLHNMLPDQLADQDHDQTTSVDLSRTANYAVSSSPPIPYSHPHHEMLRMVSLDLTSANTNMGVGNNRSFLPSQMGHNTRDTLDHHRLLSTAEQHRILAASNPEQHRLLVDPTAHLLMEQNNRLLASDQSRLLGETAQNRHMVPTRGFGAYHQVTSGNYHPSVRPVLPSPNHHTPNPSNYHPFPGYY